MAGGCLNILTMGILSWLFEIADKKKKKKNDRVEIETHTWMGMSGKTRYNRQFLGPIKIKTFLSTSRQMVKVTEKYKLVLKNLDERVDERVDERIDERIDERVDDPDYDIFEGGELPRKLTRYMRQINRRESLQCYAEWKNGHPESFAAYQRAQTEALNLNSKIERIKQKFNC